MVVWEELFYQCTIGGVLQIEQQDIAPIAQTDQRDRGMANMMICDECTFRLTVIQLQSRIVILWVEVNK